MIWYIYIYNVYIYLYMIHIPIRLVEAWSWKFTKVESIRCEGDHCCQHTGNQTWRAGKWTTKISDFPIKTSISRWFFVAVFDSWRVMVRKTILWLYMMDWHHDLKGENRWPMKTGDLSHHLNSKLYKHIQTALPANTTWLRWSYTWFLISHWEEPAGHRDQTPIGVFGWKTIGKP